MALVQKIGFQLSTWRTRNVACKLLSTSSVTSQPIVELREYDLIPGHAGDYMKATVETVELRKSLVPLRFFSLPETGGQLHVATHAYFYKGGHQERDERRGLQVQNQEWMKYVGEIRSWVHRQQSNIFIEAPLVTSMEEVLGLEKIPEQITGNNTILEIRRYKLRLGYDTVPQFLSLYQAGLPSKLHAPGTDPSTSLVTLLYSDVGRLNEVIEIWRHGNGTPAMEKSRVAARAATEWKKAISNIATLAIEFTSTIHKPTAFSPLR